MKIALSLLFSLSNCWAYTNISFTYKWETALKSSSSASVITCDTNDYKNGTHDIEYWNTCNDGIQNGDEDGIDCGGTLCAPCNTYYADNDTDTFGDDDNPILAALPPVGFVTDNTDCDDTNAAINPNALEACNGIDDNCDGQIDEGIPVVWTGAINTLWSEPGNWCGGILPGPTDAVTLPSSAANDVVVDIDASILSLDANKTLTVDPGITIDIINNNGLQIAFTVRVPFINKGTINTQHTSFATEQSYTNDGTLIITAAPNWSISNGMRLNSSQFINRGTITISDFRGAISTAVLGTGLYLNSSTFTNSNTGLLELNNLTPYPNRPFSGDGIHVSPASSFVNQGVVTMNSVRGDPIQNRGSFDNQNNIDIEIGRSVVSSSSFTNSGNISINGLNESGADGVFKISGSFLNTTSGTIISTNSTHQGMSSTSATLDFSNLGSISIDNTNPVLIDFVSAWQNDGNLIGSGQIIGELTNNGTLAPGHSVGIMQTNNTFNNLANIEIELNGTAGPGLMGGHDQIILDNGGILNGDLDVVLNYTPSDGDQFVVLSAPNSFTGDFTNYNLPTNNQLSWDIALNTNTIVLTAIVTVTVPGCTDPTAHNYNSAANQDDGSCETCSDGILNGDETGIDCGGVLCSPCNSAIPFVTTWRTDANGTPSKTITIPTTGVGYNYDVDWENDGIYDDYGLTGSITHDYTVAGTYQVAIRGDFPRIFFNNAGDREKILSVDQWGDIQWTSMSNAFKGCTALTVPAVDSPDLSNVTDMSGMFFNCVSIDQPVNHWDVITITDMSALFYNGYSFDQPLDNWDVSNVTAMSGMFFNAHQFNQDISNWDVSKVESMVGMLQGADRFNQPIGSWDVSNVTTMERMFLGANVFDQPLDNWDVGSVTTMFGMFRDSPFNQDISSWNITNVLSMQEMFYNADLFNQDINNWNVSSVTSMRAMFQDATAFNQSLNNWTLNVAVDLNLMLNNSGLNCHNYALTLDGWANNPATPSGRGLGAQSIEYGASAVANRNLLINNKGWVIVGDTPTGIACGAIDLPFVSSWQTNYPGNSCSSCIEIPATGSGYNYDVDWENDGIIDDFGLTGSTSHDYGTTGTYQIAIFGDFPRIYFNNSGDKEKILSIDQWGDIAWQSMERAFYGCTNLSIPAADAPDLSLVTDMSYMFSYASSFNNSINHWDVSNVSNMAVLFANAGAFNQPLDNWNVASVDDMSGMFFFASTFDQDISNWDVTGARNMAEMFFRAGSFNQNISAWDVSGVTSMRSMFSLAQSFDQELSNWNVTNVTDLSSMFNGSSAFNQNIGNWSLNASAILTNTLSNSNLDCDNYSATLIEWASNPLTPNGLQLGANGLQFGTNAAASRDDLLNNLNWTITGDAPAGIGCPLVLPVEWLSFTVERIDQSIRLDWQTSSETNNNYFALEHSTDGRNFTVISEQSGAGNSNSPLSYSFHHNRPQTGINYYRLRQVDYDGNSSLSEIRSLLFEQDAELRLYPNPVVESVRIRGLTSGAWEYQITDMTGRVLIKDNYLDTTILSLHPLPRGIYQIHIFQDSRQWHRLLIKQ